MSSLHLRQLDPASTSFEADLRRWHTAYVASVTYGRDHAAPYTLREIRDLVATPTSYLWCGAWLATRDDAVVGTGQLELSLVDNLAMATLDVQVVPEARRTGVGSAIAELLEGEARGRGRSVAVAEVEFRIEDPEDGAGTPGVTFAAGRGYANALGDIERRATLPLPDDLLDRLAAEAAPHHEGYVLESFGNPVPEARVAGVAALAASLMVEAPVGDLVLEPEDASVAVWREREAAMLRQGRRLWHTIALAGDEVVAYTSIAVSSDDPTACFQWGTLVRHDHRGHRLGVAVKVANHRLLQADGAPTEQVVTWNAAVNGPMITINDQLGYRPSGRLAEMQKQL
ncbi:GNAT family N-acetyltransferase [Nocardioides sp.]|uniref:GNAT family N-acetyltransferase n=1 Tax=Nocardioides sp. TaxID=35761 RepID=UPI002B83C4A0|nr:GNAT family N-acetyltransferase [Nocardioides sp.]HSX68375.1 GNAT family N-acetyltransferase [Nocardioides sp.]